MSCAHEAHVSTRTARWRRSARSSRSRSRRWQASGGEPGGEEGACPAALRTAAGKQQALRPVPATTAWHRATVLALASESDKTSRRSSPASPAHRPARCGRAPESPAQRGEGSADPPRAARANGVAYSADIRTSGLLRRLPEVLPRGLRRLWDGAPCPITLAQFPARQHLAGKIRFSGPALYYNYPLFTRSDAPFGSTTEVLDPMFATVTYLRPSSPSSWAGRWERRRRLVIRVGTCGC